VLAESAAEMPGFATSMLQDLRRGRRLEHDALNGAVVRAAGRTGIAAPLNRTLLALLAALDRGA
jgi:2-dehydropantoate 2-reductase